MADLKFEDRDHFSLNYLRSSSSLHELINDVSSVNCHSYKFLSSIHKTGLIFDESSEIQMDAGTIGVFFLNCVLHIHIIRIGS